MEPGVLEYFDGDKDSLEASLLERLGRADRLAAYKHAGFWQCMDNMRDKQTLERLWASGVPPWKRW
jgi:glucose-1-phosphate cytidylyltransferase